MTRPRFINGTQTSLSVLFVEVLRTVEPLGLHNRIADLLEKKIKLCGPEGPPHLTIDSRPLQGFVEGLGDDMHAYAEYDAKLIDSIWRARKAAGIMLLQALTSQGGVNNADRFADVAARLARGGLTSEQVQLLVNDAIVWPSLTSHPTNPFSLPYTQAGLRLDATLADPNSTREAVKEALKGVITAPMDVTPNAAGVRRKTPGQEAEELIAILDSLYRSVGRPQRELRAALDQNGYHDVRLRPILEPCVWGPGDGDGNPNMDAAALQSFVEVLTAGITERYAADLRAIESDPASPAQVCAAARAAVDELRGQPAVPSGATGPERMKAFAAARETMGRAFGHIVDTARQSGAPEALVGAAEDLVVKLETFGFHFAHIDIRHNAKDIMITCGAILSRVDGVSLHDFLAMTPENQAHLLRSRLQDTNMLLRIQQVISTPDDIDDGSGIPRRVFGRMKVVGANPDRFRKFIIAETAENSHALGALFLLKCGGVVTQVDGAQVDVVPLFESRQDLYHAPQMCHELLTDAAFGAHVKWRRHLIAMIAKSDTARLSGPGVQGAQEEAIGQLLSMQPENYGGTRMYVMLGGGDDQMRGGGRIVESPHVMMRAQAREGGHSASKICMTIQGYQLQLVFGSKLLAGHFIEAFSAQCILANARIRSWLPWRTPAAGLNELAAAKHSARFFRRAMEGYEEKVGSEEPGDAVRNSVAGYLSGFPREIIEWTNKSSRPGARKKSSDVLQGRAITLDQTAKHDGAYITASLGVPGALQHLASMLRCGLCPSGTDAPLQAHRHAYLANKAFRDFVRMHATILHQKDYHFAWEIRGGLPSSLERRQLNRAYVSGGYNPPRVLLAHLEDLDYSAARLVTEAVSGECETITGPVDLKTPLRMGWPDLAEQLEHRDRQSMVARRLELLAARRINEIKMTGADVSPHDPLRTLAYFAYVGNNASMSSPNFSLTMTDPLKKDGHLLMSEDNPALAGHIPVLAWAEGAALHDAGAKL